MPAEPSTDFPVVLRFEGMFPADLGGFEKHRTRKGGDLGHVDKSKSDLNRRLHGKEDWAERTLAEIEEMKAENFTDEIETLTRRRRKSELQKRIVEGPRDPWRATRHGPMREVILTANRKWFDEIEDLGDCMVFDKRERDFETLALAWLKLNFGDDMVHARADLDETAYHIHAVIVPKVQVNLNGTKRWMLQPSKHMAVKKYEAAQDSVGVWFSTLGLCRGERRAAAIREARLAGEIPDQKLYRHHVRTVDWRKAEDTRLVEKGQDLDKREEDLAASKKLQSSRQEVIEAREAAVEVRETAVDAREDDADAILAVGEAISSGQFTIETDTDDPDTPRLRNAPDARPGILASLRARMDKAPGAVTRALRVFSGAFSRLREDAKTEARAELERDIDEIRRADDSIVEIASHLPEPERRGLAQIRKSLTARILSLTGGTSGPRARGDGSKKR